MRAEAYAVGMRQRVNQSADPVLLVPDELAIFSAHRVDPMPGHFRSEHGRNLVREQPRAVDDATGFDFADRTGYTDSVPPWFQALDSCVRDDVGALIGPHPGVGFHKLFACDDARGRSFDRLHAGNVGLAGADRRSVDHAQALDAVLAARFDQSGQLRVLSMRGGDHDLSDPAMRNIVRGAELVGQLITAHAVPRFQRTRSVIQARVDHPAVARTGTHGKLGKRFQQEYVGPVRGQLAFARAAHYAAADNYDVSEVYGYILPIPSTGLL